MNGDFEIGAEDIEVFFRTILESNLQLLIMNLSSLHFNVMKYHKMLLGKSIWTTLRTLYISGPHSEEEKEVKLIGKSLRYNTALKELSLHGSDHGIHRNYSILWLNIAESQVIVVYSIPMDKISFFCAGRTLPQSKITSFYIWKCDRLKAKRWWRYISWPIQQASERGKVPASKLFEFVFGC